MAITSPEAIKFSNEQFRPAADRLARCYFKGVELRSHWLALGGTNDEKYALLQDKVERVATLFSVTREFIFRADRIWNSDAMQTLIPNDANEELWDDPSGGQQDPYRPPVNGQDLRRLKARMEEFNNWLDRGTDADKHFVNDASAILPITYGYLDDVFRVSQFTSNNANGNQAGRFASLRCGDFETEFTGAKLNHVLTVAVNPERAR